MSLLLSPSGRGAAPAAGSRLCTREGGISAAVLRAPQEPPWLPQAGAARLTSPRMLQVYSRSCGGSARAAAGGCMDAACAGWLGSLFQPSHGCQDPTKVPSSLTLTRHMPIAPHSGAPASGPYAATASLSPPQHCRMWPGRCHGRQVKQPLCISSPTAPVLSATPCRLICLPGTSVPCVVVTSGGSGWTVLMLGQLFRGTHGCASEGAVAGLFSPPSPSAVLSAP